MKILKRSKQENKNEKIFSCQKCGCEFIAEEDEYAEKYTIYLSNQKEYVCSCPECHKIITLKENISNGGDYLRITPEGGISWSSAEIYTVPNEYSKAACSTASTFVSGNTQAQSSNTVLDTGIAVTGSAKTDEVKNGKA